MMTFVLGMLAGAVLLVVLFIVIFICDGGKILPW